MATNDDQPVARLGDVHAVGVGSPLTGSQLADAITVERVTPGALARYEMVRVSAGMPLQPGDIVNSRAYVSGLDIVFGDRVESLVGRGLLAHEVTHVVQQGQVGTSPVNNGATQGPNPRD